ELDSTLPPGRRVGRMQWAHVHGPIEHERIEKAFAGPVGLVRPWNSGQTFSRFVEPTRGVERIGGPAWTSAIGRRDTVVIIGHIHVMGEEQLLEMIDAGGSMGLLF